MQGGTWTYVWEWGCSRTPRVVAAKLHLKTLADKLSDLYSSLQFSRQLANSYHCPSWPHSIHASCEITSLADGEHSAAFLCAM